MNTFNQIQEQNNGTNNNKRPFNIVKNAEQQTGMNPLIQMQQQQQYGNSGILNNLNSKRSFDMMSSNDNMQSNTQMQQQYTQMGANNFARNDLNLMNINSQRKTNKELSEMHDEQRAEQEKKINLLLKDYDSCHFKYTSDSFTFQANYFLQKIASESHASLISSKYPLFKMLRSIAKKFLFNDLEIIFFAYILRENKWKVDDEKIKQWAPKMKDFLNQNEVTDTDEYLKLLLYLILNAYAVKYYLNDIVEMEMYEAHMTTIIPDFSILFNYWSNKFATTSLKINPKILNKVFITISQKSIDKKKSHEDYNQLVDNIIQISPPYSSTEKQLSEQQVVKRDRDTPLPSVNNNYPTTQTASTYNGGAAVGFQQHNNPQSSQAFLAKLYQKTIQKKQEQQTQQQVQNHQQNINTFINSNVQANLLHQGDNHPNYSQNSLQQQQQQQQLSLQNNAFSFSQNDILQGAGMNSERFYTQNKPETGADPFQSIMENSFELHKSQLDQMPILKGQQNNSFIPNNNGQQQFNRIFSQNQNLFAINDNSPFNNNMNTSQFSAPTVNQKQLNDLLYHQNFQGVSIPSNSNTELTSQTNKAAILVPKPNKISDFNPQILKQDENSLINTQIPQISFSDQINTLSHNSNQKKKLISSSSILSA